MVVAQWVRLLSKAVKAQTVPQPMPLIVKRLSRVCSFALMLSWHAGELWLPALLLRNGKESVAFTSSALVQNPTPIRFTALRGYTEGLH